MDFHDSDQNRNLSPTQLAHKVIAEIRVLAGELSPNQQRIIEEYCNEILQNRSAIAEAVNLLPLEAALIIIQVWEHENNNHEISELHKEFCRQMGELRGEIDELKKWLNEKT